MTERHPRKVAIIGHAKEKFTPETEEIARHIIRHILSRERDIILVSGRSPMGGIDVWAEEEADRLGVPKRIFAPKQHSWGGEYGFRARNIDIAKYSDEVHIILVSEYPPGYKGMRFDYCYHCAEAGCPDPRSHVKSGACWTGHLARKMGKKVVWHII